MKTWQVSVLEYLCVRPGVRAYVRVRACVELDTLGSSGERNHSWERCKKRKYTGIRNS